MMLNIKQFDHFHEGYNPLFFLNYLRKFSFLFLLLALLSCPSQTTMESSKNPKKDESFPKEETLSPEKKENINNPEFTKARPEKKEKSKQVTIAFAYTGELLGELEPCGCSSIKRGGMAIRSGWVNHLRTQYENLCLVDGGFAAREENRQNEIKACYHYTMLKTLGYDLQFISQQERTPSLVESTFPFLKQYSNLCFVGVGNNAPAWHRTWEIKTEQGQCTVLFIAMEETLPKTEEISTILTKVSPNIVFILAKKSGENYVSRIPTLDSSILIFFFLLDSPEPFSPIQFRTNFWVLSAGNKGRYLGLIQFIWENNAVVSWKNETLVLEKKFEPDPKITSLIHQYQEQVKSEHLLEKQMKRISPVGFVGSEICGSSCHPYEYEEWQKKKHAQAFETLVKENYHYDPECVGCHTVGYEYEEGFRTLEETPHLIHVGCESCHRAGATHTITPAIKQGETGGPNACLSCHQPDRSPDFAYEKYKEKIVHWKEKSK